MRSRSAGAILSMPKASRRCSASSPKARGEEVAGAEPGELAPGLRVGLAHQERCVTPREEVEPDAPALGQQLADLGVVALAAALLVCAAGVAAVEPALPVALAEGAGQGLLVRELCLYSIGTARMSHGMLSTVRIGN